MPPIITIGSNLPHSAGVYAIRNIISDKRYVGSSKSSILKRWRIHKTHLIHGKHHSPKLQRAWNKYGEENFEIIVLEKCMGVDTVAREQYWIDHLDAFKNGYNSTPMAIDCSGRPVSAGTRLKIANSLLGRKSYERTQAQVDTVSKSKHKPVFQYTIEGDFVRGYASQKEAALLLGFEKSQLSNHLTVPTRTCQGYRWFYKYQGLQIKPLSKTISNLTVNGRYKIRLAVSKPVLLLGLSGELIQEYASAKDAAQAMGFASATSITWRCKGTLKNKKSHPTDIFTFKFKQ